MATRGCLLPQPSSCCTLGPLLSSPLSRSSPSLLLPASSSPLSSPQCLLLLLLCFIAISCSSEQLQMHTASVRLLHHGVTCRREMVRLSSVPVGAAWPAALPTQTRVRTRLNKAVDKNSLDVFCHQQHMPFSRSEVDGGNCNNKQQ